MAKMAKTGQVKVKRFSSFVPIAEIRKKVSCIEKKAQSKSIPKITLRGT